MKHIAALTALVLGAVVLNAEEARLLRFPSTNGDVVVFSYAGDLYKAPLSGGEASRLTSHNGYEMFARFSPDGKTIAFTGQFDGNTEVYSIPVGGGEPKRLTWTSTNGRDDIGDRMGPNNIVMGWSPDGKSITYRNRSGDGFIGKLWTVGVQGGESKAIELPEGGFCCWSPDGKKLAYNRTMREFRTWKYYRGGQADDIWIWDGKSVRNITDNPAQDIMPMWIGDEIFFISDRDKTMNLFVYNTKSGKTEKVTDFNDYDIKFPSSNGKLIVFENAGYLYRFDPASRELAKINISLGAEGLYARPVKMHVDHNLSAGSISSKADRVAITARGEVFSIPVKPGVTRNITRTPGANDRGAVYSPDGRYIAYISDRTGETEVWMLDVDKNETIQLTDGSDTYIRSIVWAPDSKTLIYTDRKNRVVSVAVPGGAKKTVMQDGAGEFRGVSFSPDSKWITYTRTGENQMSVVYVRELTSGREIAVTERWYDSGSPMFSQDGKYLFFTSARDLNPTYSSVEWNYAYSNMNAMYFALLDKTTRSPFLASDGVGAESAKGDAKDKAEVSVKVDAEGIFDRIIRVPVNATRPVYCDGKNLWFSGRGGVSIFNFESGETSQIDGTIMSIVGDKALMRKNGSFVVGDIPKGKGNGGKTVDISNMVADIDWNAEWAQIFDEAWRAFRDGFYLENMHGMDWPAIKAKYQVLLPYVKTRLDLNYVIGEMIGELNCGHAYVNPGNHADTPERIPMGLLGARLSRSKDGASWRIDHIYKGAVYSASLRSPLTEPGIEVAEGDFITAVDGIPVSSVSSIYELLVGKAGVLTELSISGKGGKDAHKIVVKPIDNEYPLEHFEWVQHNIEYVEKASDGKIGYIYIPDMSQEGLNEFVRYYYPQLDKQALIIDDRANGGGNVSPMIIERLMRDPYRLTMRRGSDLIGTVPEGSFVGPKVCLINKYSASDGDLFPWSFKETGLGELIGTRTWGGIVGISGSLPFMDGTDIRVPFFTNYSRADGEWIIENHGVDPDIYVDNDPIKEMSGIDQQLDKAIEVLMGKLKERKALPGVPAPRDFSWK